MKTLIAILPLLLLAATCAPPQYASTSWDGVQQERQALGLQPFDWDDELAEMANARANEMADEGRISHDTSPRYFGCVGGYDWIGEVVGRQPLWERPDAIAYGWHNSPKHYWAITIPEFRYAGIAAYVGEDGWVYESMWMSSVRPDCKEGEG